MIIVRWLVGVIAILITVGIVHALGMPLDWPVAWHVVLFVPILAIINALIGPILRLLLLPLNCMTFGLFSFVINAILFGVAGRLTGAHINVWGALVGSIIYGILSTVLSWPIKERRND